MCGENIWICSRARGNSMMGIVKLRCGGGIWWYLELWLLYLRLDTLIILIMPRNEAHGRWKFSG